MSAVAVRQPDPLPMSLPAGTFADRRKLRAVGVVTLTQGGYLGNWQPPKPNDENPQRKGASWLAAYAIEWVAR